MAAIGTFFLIVFAFSGLMTSIQTGVDTTAITLPFMVVLMGLIILATFITFRTERRRKVVGIWHAD